MIDDPPHGPDDGRPIKEINGAFWPLTDDEWAELKARQALPSRTVAPTISFLQFMALFTPAEQAAVMTARRTDVQVDLFVTMAAGSGGLQLDNAQVVQGVEYLAAQNLISQAEATRILAGTPPGP